MEPAFSVSDMVPGFHLQPCPPAAVRVIFSKCKSKLIPTAENPLKFPVHKNKSLIPWARVALLGDTSFSLICIDPATFGQPATVKCLLGVRHCSKLLGNSSEQNRQNSHLHQAGVVAGETDKKQTNDISVAD